MRPRFLQHNERPLILAHRGASADFPENSLRAFREALRAGADGVELDVMCCGSGEVVVVHDDDLSRVTGAAPGSQQPVRQTHLRELRRFDIGLGERVPLLEEVLEELGPAALVNIELKSPDTKTLPAQLRLLRDDQLAAATAQVLRRTGRLWQGTSTLVSSFDPLQLSRFRRCVGRFPDAFLFHRDQAPPLRRGWPARLLRTAALHPEASLVDAVALRAWRQRGYRVHVWTVDDPREIRALCALGVDGIITNRPTLAREIVGG